MKNIFLLFALIIIATHTYAENKKAYQADVIIYGGTSAAIISAVQVLKLGKSVIIVSPDQHLGGLSSGGLGFTDTGNKSVIGGLAREFYHRLYQHYQSDNAWKWQQKASYGNKGQGTPAMDGAARTMWIFEPHVAEQVFEDFVKEHNITITTLSGKKFIGKIFIDATYEGDLMAAAKVSYHVGREANSVYNEEWNGIQVGTLHHDHHFKTNISPYKTPGDPTSGLLAGVSADDPGKKGDGDHRIQAYCFRMCLTNHPENRVPFPKPDGYDPAQYELLARVFESGWREMFNKFDLIPNRKTDANNHGPFSTDYIGMNYDYPEASYSRRKEIIKAHENYQKGLMYFMANDPKVPLEVRTRMEKWGLAKDEFKDNGNWPHQLYIREARRMIGKEVMTEHEVLGKRAVSTSVGMGSYTLDSHNTQRYIKPDGFVQNEGDIGVKAEKPYKISYGSIVPRKEECENLLVPVCMSSSHIAFGSIRMEPVFMILGQSAATAAVQAINDRKAVQDIDYNKLKIQLIADQQQL
jgi:hypothetical protein